MSIRTQKITEEGFRRLSVEEVKLKAKKEEALNDLREAKEQGDLRENSAYDIAKNEVRRLDEMILNIKNLLESSRIIHLTPIDPNTTISLGRIITLLDLDKKEKQVYKIVSPGEAQFLSSEVKEIKEISINSPLAKELLNKKIKEEFVYITPKNENRKYKIFDITNSLSENSETRTNNKKQKNSENIKKKPTNNSK